MGKNTEIYFGTKEDSNDRRLKETLARTPHERFMFFLELCGEMQWFENERPHPNRSKNNFVLE